MLDIQFIREHADVVKESQRKRGESVELVDEVLRADDSRRTSLKAVSYTHLTLPTTERV